LNSVTDEGSIKHPFASLTQGLESMLPKCLGLVVLSSNRMHNPSNSATDKGSTKHLSLRR